MIKKPIITLLALLFMHSELYSDFYYSDGKKHTLKKIKTDRTLGTNDKYSFQTEHGQTVKINRGLIVSYSDKNIQKIVEKKYNLKFIKALTNKMYLYRINDASKTVETSNLIYEEEGIEFCHPDFQRTKKSRAITNDPYAYDSWHLFDNWQSDGGDVNVEQAWQYTKGAGVKVAVYDKGIDINHPDLRENIFAFRNYNDPISDIPYINDDTNWHGTACAGILAAKENNIGSVGIAPQSSLYAVGYSEDNISKDIEAYAWMMNEGVSVINNSWGSYSSLDAYSSIFKLLATKGRDGKGIILVFAAGNGDDYGVAINLDRQNFNDESESPYVFSIAASTRRNTIASYSNYGKSIDFTAPGGSNGTGIITTDAIGSLGYNSSNYNMDFTGTSASAPIVSGAVALMISSNPKLTREDIFTILKFTASKKGNYSYDENGHNIHWGYGKINAGRAVEIAHAFGDSNLKNFAQTMFNEVHN